MRLRWSLPGPVRLDELADQANLEAEDLESQRLRHGFNLAWGIIGLIGLVIVFVGLFAWLSYPEPTETKDLVGTQKALEAERALRGDWVASIKDLLQLLVVSLLVPLLATLIGYIFGRQVGAAHGAQDASRE